MSKISKFHQKSHFFGKNAKIMKFCPNVKIDLKTVWKHQNRRWKALNWNFPKNKKNCIFDHFWALHPIFHTHMPFSDIGNFGQPHALLIFKNGQIERIEKNSDIKNMDHKLSNDVSNVFIQHLVQILSHFEIFSKHVILTRKRGGV